MGLKKKFKILKRRGLISPKNKQIRVSTKLFAIVKNQIKGPTIMEGGKGHSMSCIDKRLGPAKKLNTVQKQ